MGFRDMPLRGPRVAIIITAVTFWSCSSEEPSFTEHRETNKQFNSKNAYGEINSESDNNPILENADQDGLGNDAGGLDGVTGQGNGAIDGGGGIDGGGIDGGGIDGGSGADSGSGSDGAISDVGGNDSGSSDGGSSDGGSNGSEPGIEFTLHSQTLIQESPGTVDILWVIDSSGSMSEEQAYLGDNFNSFITEMNNAGHDAQLAVTSTDVCDDVQPPQLVDRSCPAGYGGNSSTRLKGSFIGVAGQQVLKATDSDVIQKFNAYTSVGINGSGFEHGLYGAKLALDKVASGANDNLLRNDSYLAVIVVSDEEDDGIGLWQTDAYNGYNFATMGLTEFKYTEDDFIDDVKLVKGNKFSVSAITGTRDANGDLCSAPHSQPREEGTQYIKAAQKTGGIIQSICETDWGTSLANIGLDLSAQATQVELEKIPNVATIKVWVNSVLTDKWSYSAGTNTVKFDIDAIPAPGQEIKVEYYGY